MAENIEEDKASWAEVQVTFILTVGTSAIFLGIFEIARRSPVISSVFDRRRNSKPHRTPPPLLSTSIFEWLFLSSEPRYSEYSDLSHMRDVIQERRRQRNPGRSGFFSSGRGNRDDDGRSSDLDSPRDTVDPRVSTIAQYLGTGESFVLEVFSDNSFESILYDARKDQIDSSTTTFIHTSAANNYV